MSIQGLLNIRLKSLSDVDSGIAQHKIEQCAITLTSHGWF